MRTLAGIILYSYFIGVAAVGCVMSASMLAGNVVNVLPKISIDTRPPSRVEERLKVLASQHVAKEKPKAPAPAAPAVPVAVLATQLDIVELAHPVPAVELAADRVLVSVPPSGTGALLSTAFTVATIEEPVLLQKMLAKKPPRAKAKIAARPSSGRKVAGQQAPAKTVASIKGSSKLRLAKLDRTPGQLMFCGLVGHSTSCELS